MTDTTPSLSTAERSRSQRGQHSAPLPARSATGSTGDNGSGRRSALSARHDTWTSDTSNFQARSDLNSQHPKRMGRTPGPDGTQRLAIPADAASLCAGAWAGRWVRRAFGPAWAIGVTYKQDHLDSGEHRPRPVQQVRGTADSHRQGVPGVVPPVAEPQQPFGGRRDLAAGVGAAGRTPNRGAL